MITLVEQLAAYSFVFGVIGLAIGHLIGYAGPLSLVARLLDLFGAALIGSAFCLLSGTLFLTQERLTTSQSIFAIIGCLALLAIGLLCLVGSVIQSIKFWRNQPFFIEKKRYEWVDVKSTRIRRSAKGILRKHSLLVYDKETEQTLSQSINWFVYNRLIQKDLNQFPTVEIEHRGNTALCRSIVLIDRQSGEAVKIV